MDNQKAKISIIYFRIQFAVCLIGLFLQIALKLDEGT